MLRVSMAAAVLVGLLTCGASLLLDVWDCYVQHVESKGFRDTSVLSLFTPLALNLESRIGTEICVVYNTCQRKALAFCTYVIFMHSLLSRLAKQTLGCKSSNSDLPFPFPSHFRRKTQSISFFFKQSLNFLHLTKENKPGRHCFVPFIRILHGS